MGSLLRSFEQSMTKPAADVAVDFVRSERARVSKITPRTKWYLFGSVTRAKRPVSDIDLLIVCDQDEDCAIVRNELRDSCLRYPIHLMLMTRAEEVELDFVKGEAAVELTAQAKTD